MPSFNAISRRYTPQIVSSRKKYKFCKYGGKLIIDILMYLYDISGKLLASHFFIRNGDC